MKLSRNYIAGGVVLLVWCLFMGVTAISIGIGSLVPQLNTIATPFVCPGGTMSLEQQAFTVSPVEHGVTQTWYCVNGATGARTELSLGSISFTAGPIYGLLLFLAVLAAIPLARRWPRAVGYSVVGLIVGGVLAFNLVDIFGSLFSTSQSTSDAGTRPSPTLAQVNFAHVVLSFALTETPQGKSPGHNIAVAADGTIYADDWDALQVQKYDSAGKHIGGWNVDASQCSSKIANVDTLDVDRAGSVFLFYCDSILKYDGTTGKLLAQFSGDRSSTGDVFLNEALYPDGGLLVVARVAGGGNEVILHLDADGKVLARYPNLVTPQSSSPILAAALYPAVDSLGNIFLLDTQGSVVYKFSSDGKYVNKFGSVGTGAGQFDYRALRIAIDDRDRVYVVDVSGIKVFDSNGTFVESMSGGASMSGIFDIRIAGPNDIYLVTDANMIYKLARNTK